MYVYESNSQGMFLFFWKFWHHGTKKNPVPRIFLENIYAKGTTFWEKIFNFEIAIFRKYIAKAKQDSRTFLLSSMTSFSQIWRLPLKDDHQSTYLMHKIWRKETLLPNMMLGIKNYQIAKIAMIFNSWESHM